MTLVSNKVYAGPVNDASQNQAEYRDETQRRTNAYKPSIGAVSQPIKSGNGRWWKDVLWIGVFPPIAWSIVIAIIPLKEAVSGLSWDNIPFLIYSSLIIAFTTSVYHCNNLWFYQVTVKMSVIAGGGSIAITNVLFIAVMALDAFPISFWNPLCILGPWFPAHVGMYYYQFIKAGLLDNTDKGAVLDFLKWQLVLVICGVFAFLSMAFILAFFLANGATQQISVLTIYALAGYLLRNVSMPLIEAIIPQRLTTTTRDGDTNSELRLAMIRYSLYYGLDVCQEIFATLSLFEIADITSALLVVAQELIPMALSLLKFHPKYYDFVKKRHPARYLGVTLSSHRLLMCEHLALKVLAELVASVGVVIIAFAMRYGPNEEFFPLRSSCEKDFLFAASVNLLLLVSVALMSLIFDFVCRHYYGLHLFRLVGRHLRFNFRMMLSFTVTLYVFPAGLLLKQMNLLVSVNEGSYYPPTTNC